jgi:hypothetical protein
MSAGTIEAPALAELGAAQARTDRPSGPQGEATQRQATQRQATQRQASQRQASQRQATQRQATQPTAPLRAGRGTGRATVPQLRPAVRLPAPTLSRAQPRRVAACLEAAPASPWRLTERGLALVLVTGLMIAAAALAVIGLTALQVTSEGYQPYGASQLGSP